jgi:hypothetical protein
MTGVYYPDFCKSPLAEVEIVNKRKGITAVMKGIDTSWQELNSGGVASFSVPRDGVSHLAFPALAPERNHHDGSFPLAPLGNEPNSSRDERGMI